MAKQFVLDTHATPSDEVTAAIIKDPVYEKKMDDYDQALARKTTPIWKEVYLNGARR
jgi:hypothetical protein